MPGSRNMKPSSGRPKKPPLTHFLCLPLVTPHSKPQLEKSLQHFRDAVAAKDDAPTATVMPGVPPQAIRPVGALHCTLGVMTLDPEKLQRAIHFLTHLDITRLMHDQGRVTPQQPGTALAVHLTGLLSMHPPRHTSMLYCAPTDADGSDKLYPFCLAVRKAFTEQRLLVEDARKLKLHATILNTIYAKGKNKRPAKPRQTDASDSALDTTTPDPTTSPNQQISPPPRSNDDAPSDGHGPTTNAPLKIDATAILDQFKDFVWAQNVVVDRIAICEMGAKKILDERGEVVAEEYREVASLKLPP
ncbi:AKAP7 2'5' RNA ligase-like domain [Teratosphaeria destructans]|uniref:AKAP7 2'5' RNA ligase-like domain n=1 Tax=Teratosphaeria destructans TaxID=418781 RepID=A0A9W7SNW1_9PEZI|nr:AKAP7 2'5' RNA ligase-like domain [Teratosphaeria destructans]